MLEFWNPLYIHPYRTKEICILVNGEREVAWGMEKMVLRGGGSRSFDLPE